MDKEIVKIEDLTDEKIITDKPKTKLNLFKFFSGKNIKIAILVIIAIVSLIVFIKFGGAKSESKKTSADSAFEYKSTMDYCGELERKLESVLSQVKGAGTVKVMISLEGSPELVYAMDSDTKVSNNSNGSTTTSSSTPILIQKSGSSSPLILTEILPKVKGVIVVSSGASDIGIKLDILNSVSTLLDISTDKINVLKGI